MDLRKTIHDAASAAFSPSHIEVSDESHGHSRGLQTHFKLVIVSAEFHDMPPVRRHQAVYAALGDLMGRFHALALHTYTPGEWQRQSAAPASPSCRGGSLGEV